MQDHTPAVVEQGKFADREALRKCVVQAQEFEIADCAKADYTGMPEQAHRRLVGAPLER
ncbi:MAG TPA: hypothetical protein VHI11_10310 [Jiangellaceae bacterium]|nr:hypothetical protein [Jiangellaceae bacterium]